MKQEDILIWLQELADDMKSLHKHSEMDDLRTCINTTNYVLTDDFDKCAVHLCRETFEKIVNLIDVSVYLTEGTTMYHLHFEMYDVLFFTTYDTEVKDGN